MGMAAGQRMGDLGDLLPTIVWPSDVRRKKNELDTFMRALDVSFDACQGLSTEEAIAYDNFSKAWRAFYAEDDSNFLGFGAANRWDEALRYQDSIHGWQQDIFAPKCGLVGPKVKPPDVTPTEDLLSTVKVVAVVGAVIAGVVLVAPIVYEAVASAKLARRAVSR